MLPVKTGPFLHASSACGKFLVCVTGSRLFFDGFLQAGVEHIANGSGADAQSCGNLRPALACIPQLNHLQNLVVQIQLEW